MTYRLVSPIVEIREINGTNYAEVMEWCGGMIAEEYDGTATMYFYSYHPEYKVNNRLDFPIGKHYPVFTTYIAKLENGHFVSFESQHLDSALEPVE